MPNKVYGPLDPRGWGKRGGSQAAPLVSASLDDPVGVLRRGIEIASYEADRAAALGRGNGGHEDNSYDAERHARAAYRAANAFGVVPTVVAGVGNELPPMMRALARARATGDLDAIGQAARSSAMDIQNNNVGVGEAFFGRPIPTRSTPGLRTIR